MKNHLERFQAEPLELSKLGHYEKWALANFHDSEKFVSPNLSLTLGLDITGARSVYESRFTAPGSSFTAYLIFQLIQALKRHDCFNYRDIDGRWYVLKNPPVFIPVATGGTDRFREIYLEDAFLMDWSAFRERYRADLGQALQGRACAVGAEEGFYELAVMIGNLPHTAFTAFHLHQAVRNTGRPVFYFGERHETGGELRVPLSVTLDHSNTDPFVCDLLLKDYRRFLAGEVP